MFCRAEYVQKGRSLRAIAKEYDLDLDELRQIAELEDWRRERLVFVNEVYVEMREQTKKTLISTYTNTVNLNQLLTAWAAQQFDTRGGKVSVDPELVHRILRTVGTSLEVMKYTMGDPGGFASPDLAEDRKRSSEEKISEYEEELRALSARSLSMDADE